MSNAPTTWSVNALAEELGIDRRTLKKRLANVPPAEIRGKSKRYRLRDVLAAVEPPRQLEAERDPADFLRAYAMTGRRLKPGVNLVDWKGACEAFEIDGDELREWLRFSAPWTKQGSLKTGRGWEFSLPHVMRWLGLWMAALQGQGLLHADSDHRFGDVTRGLLPPG